MSIRLLLAEALKEVQELQELLLLISIALDQLLAPHEDISCCIHPIREGPDYQHLSKIPQKVTADKGMVFGAALLARLVLKER